MSDLLVINELSKNFGGVCASDRVNFTVDKGEIVGLIGPNGAGKTTVFNLISGFVRPDSGQVTFDDKDVTGLRPDQISRLGIARTFQILKPFPRMTVEENVMVGALIRHPRPAVARELAGHCIELVGLEHKRADLGGELSTGQRKRLEMARAMATEPRLLLLDEITGGVDQPSIPGLMKLVGSLRDEGVTLLIIEHNMRVVMELADRVIFLNLGAKLTEGPPREVAANPEVRRLYLGSGHA
jgi:branched-chain amino acid transport system ATP-binding protein